jgi:hypothetical protein
MGWMDVATAETRRAFHVLGCTIRIHTAVASVYLLYIYISFLYFSISHFICCWLHAVPVQKWSHASHNEFSYEFSMSAKTSHLSVSSHCRRTHMRI